MKLVIVEWVDSVSYNGWKGREEVEAEGTLCCVSVGWLLKDDDDQITLVSSVNDTDVDKCTACHGDITIPRVAVMKVYELTDV